MKFVVRENFILNELLLREEYSIGNGIIAFGNAYTLLNWLEDQKRAIRVFYDDYQDVILAADALNHIHADMFWQALQSNLYELPLKYKDIYGEEITANDIYEMENYRDDGQGVYHIPIMFCPVKDMYVEDMAYQDDYAYDIYAKGVGHFYLRTDEDAEFFKTTELYNELEKRCKKITQQLM